MKTKQFKSKQLLKLYLLKFRTHENTLKKNNLKNLTALDSVRNIVDFKKALDIVFKYNRTGRKIVFVGVPEKVEAKINKLTCHTAISSRFDLQNILFPNDFNQFESIEHNKRGFSKINLKLLSTKLSKKTELIVMFSYTRKQLLTVKNFSSKIPLIVFANEEHSDTSLFNDFHNVTKIAHNLPVMSLKNIFFFCSGFLFTREIQF